MKLATIVPTDIPLSVKQAMEDELKRIGSPGTDTALFVTKIERFGVAGDIDLTVPAAMELAVNAEKNNFDAIILNAM